MNPTKDVSNDTTDSPWPQRKTLSIATGLVAMGFLAGSLILGSIQTPAPSIASTPNEVLTMSQPQEHGVAARGFSHIVKAVRPAVVNITASKPMTQTSMNQIPRPDWFGRGFGDLPFLEPPTPHGNPQPPFGSGMGSGVLVTPDGYIVTNHHVVEGAKEVSVTLPDKREFSGTIIGSDPQTDFAVVKIEGENLPYVPWGNSSNLEVGDYVLAIGNPFGLTSTVTQGIVSGLGRGGMGITQYEDFIQTDAAINPGNSGGALVNVEGELIGINTAIMSRTGGSQGVGFAIPASMGKPIYESLVKSGKVVRGYLGVGIQEITPDLATTFHLPNAKGVLVTDVKPHSPASQAGLERGDAITTYQGKPITGPRGLQQVVTRTPVHSEITMTIIRDGKEQEIRTTIGEHPDSVQMAQNAASSKESELVGVAVKNLNPHMAQQLGLSPDIAGVVVTAVQPGSHAAQAGISQGDVISEINRHPVHSLAEYDHLVSTLSKEDRALLLVYRKGVPLFLSVKV